MTFDYEGYELKFVQKEPCRDCSAHLYTLVYKFYSPVTKYFYILRADYHKRDFFGIKFYCKKDSHCDYKYSKIINKGDLGNIMVTCAEVVPLLLRNYPNASFGMVGARTVDTASQTVESYNNNQRFRLYKYFIPLKIREQTFAHIAYEEVSGYLLINRNCENIEAKEKELAKMLSETYTDIHDVC